MRGSDLGGWIYEPAIHHIMTGDGYSAKAKHYFRLMHDVLSLSPELSRKALMGLAWNSGTWRLSQQILAVRLAFALHDDPKLLNELCAAIGKEKYCDETSGFSKQIRYTLENLKRHNAMVESGVKDNKSVYLMETFGILSTDKEHLKEMNDSNAEIIMKATHWTVLLKNYDQFVKYGLKPQDEIRRQSDNEYIYTKTFFMKTLKSDERIAYNGLVK